MVWLQSEVPTLLATFAKIDYADSDDWPLHRYLLQQVCAANNIRFECPSLGIDTSGEPFLLQTPGFPRHRRHPTP